MIKRSIPNYLFRGTTTGINTPQTGASRCHSDRRLGDAA
jgi:hypothetical protein